MGKGNSPESEFLRQHYGGQAEQLEKELAAAGRPEPSAKEIAEGVLRHLDPPPGEYPSRAAAALAALDASENNSEPAFESREITPEHFELRVLLAEKEKWERRYHELAAAAIQLPFKASADRLLLDGLRKIIAELAALKRPLRLCQPGRAEHLIDAATQLLEPTEKASDAEQREWEEKGPAAFSRKVAGCKSCPFSDGVAGEWCRRYSRFNPPHELEAWGRPEWCESGDIVITIEETEIEDDKGDQRVKYTSGEKK